MNDLPPLRGVECRNCSECRGRGSVRNRTCPSCHGRRVVITQHGKPIKLESTPQERPERQPDLRKRLGTMAQRKADGVCVRCGDPNLVTDNHCESCRQITNALWLATNGRGEL